MQGKLEEVRSLVGRRKLAFCRDPQGASPLHKAVLFQQRNMVAYFVESFPSVMHARDHQGRTPLHYAAVLHDNSEIYRMLKVAGSDENATDVYGHTPDFYLEAPGELSLEQLKEGATTANKCKKAKHRRKKSGENETASIRGYSAKPAGLKVQIREVIAQGNLEALEELVLHGHGDRLLGETSPNPVVQEFLDTVPGYMEQMNDVHRAVVRGRLREVQTLMNHKSLSLARDSLGAAPIHKAIMHGHYDIAQHLAENFMQCLSAKDIDGRTALHYAAALKDGRRMYNMLVLAGSPTTIVDSKGKTADYYLQYPEKMNMDQIVKRNQLANATYLGNTIGRLKTLAPAFQKTIVNMHERYQLTNGPLDGNQDAILNGDDEMKSDVSEENPDEKVSHVATQADALKKVMIRNKPFLPPVILPRLEVTSANIRKWIDDQDMKKLEGAVFEGYGERLAQETSSNHEEVERYLRKDVPRMLERIQAIHRAVADDDVPGLESRLDSVDYALARDHMGMTPLHRAVVLGRPDAVRLLVEKFPETINARDREGRTALHYAAATSRRSGRSQVYRLLLQNGSDPRIRDNRGKSSEFYKTHHMALPPEAALLAPSAKTKARSRSEPPDTRPRKNSYASTLVAEKLTSALQQGNSASIKELILDGHGKHLLGRTSWNEEVRQILKSLPTFLQNVNATHEAIAKGDVAKLRELAAVDENYLRARDEFGCHPIHAAIESRQLEAARLILQKFPTSINLKATHGRNPLHLAGLRKDKAMYKLLVQNGADPKALDQKGKTADYYMKNRKGRSRSSASCNSPRGRSPSKYKPSSENSTKVETVVVPATEKGMLGSGFADTKPQLIVGDDNGSDVKVPQSTDTANKEGVDADHTKAEDVDDGAAESDSGDPEGKRSPNLPSNSHPGDVDLDVSSNVCDQTKRAISTGGSTPPHADEQGHIPVNSLGRGESEHDDSVGGGDADDQPEVSPVVEKTLPSSSDGAEDGISADGPEVIEDTVNAMTERNNLNSTILKQEEEAQPSSGDVPERPKPTSSISQTKQTIENGEHSNVQSELEGDKIHLDSDNYNPLSAANQTLELKRTQDAYSNSPTDLAPDNDDRKEGDCLMLPNHVQCAEMDRTVSQVAEDPISQPETRMAEIDSGLNSIAPDQYNAAKGSGSETQQHKFLENSDANENMYSPKPGPHPVPEYSDKQLISNDLKSPLNTNEVACEKSGETKITEVTVPQDILEYKGCRKQPHAKSKGTLGGKIGSQTTLSKASSRDAIPQNKNSEGAPTDFVQRSVSVGKTNVKGPESKMQRNDRPETFEETGPEDSEALEQESVSRNVDADDRESDSSALHSSDSSNTYDSPRAKSEAIPEKGAESVIAQKGTDHSSGHSENQNEVKNVRSATFDVSEELENREGVCEDTVPASMDISNKTNESSTKNSKDTNDQQQAMLEHKELKKGVLTSMVQEDATTLLPTLSAEQQATSDKPVTTEQSTLEETDKKNVHDQGVSDDVAQDVIEESNGRGMKLQAQPPATNRSEAPPQDPLQEADVLQENTVEIQHAKSLAPPNKSQITEASFETPHPEELSDEYKASADQFLDAVSLDAGEGKTKGSKPKVEDSSSSADKKKCVQNKGSNLSSSTATQLDRLNELIDTWIQEGDLLRLEHVVIAGQGERLLNKTSEDKQVQEFLTLVPAYMERIRTVHETVVRGNLSEVRQVLTRKRFALSRDRLGASPLHLAVLHGHTDILHYIVDRFPETLDGPDNEGRTPLHYAAVVMEAQNYFDILKKAGADDTIKDKMGHTPEFYLKNPKELTIRDLLESYQTMKEDDKSATADVWKRPPTPPGDPTESEAIEPSKEGHEIPAVKEQKGDALPVPQEPTTEKTQVAVEETAKENPKPDANPTLPAQDPLHAILQESAPQPEQELAVKDSGQVPPQDAKKDLQAEPVQKPMEAAIPQPSEELVRNAAENTRRETAPKQPKMPEPEPAKATPLKPVEEPVLVPVKVTAQAVATGVASVPAPAPVPAPAKSTTEDERSAEIRQITRDLLLKGRTAEEAQYLTGAVGDALSKNLHEVSEQRPQDPVNFMVSKLKQQASQNTVPVGQRLPEAKGIAAEESISSRTNTNSSSATR